MTDDRAALVDVILGYPGDDTPRLVFADWCRDHDDPGYQLGGRFLWAGVEASRHRESAVITDPQYYLAMEEMELTAPAVVPRLLASLGLDPDPAAFRWACRCDEITAHYGRGRWAYFTRGMLSGLKLPLAEWEGSAAEVLRRCPLERVEVTDVPGLRFEVAAADGWGLTGVLSVPNRGLLLPPGTLLPRTEWRVVRPPAGTRRAELVAALGEVIPDLVDRLRHAAGDRWPSRPLPNNGRVYPPVLLGVDLAAPGGDRTVFHLHSHGDAVTGARVAAELRRVREQGLYGPGDGPFLDGEG